MLAIRRRRAGAGPAPEASVPAELSVLDHLSELRDRIIKATVAVAVGALVCWFLYPAIFDVLVDPYCNLQGATVDDCRLLQTEPLEAFSIRLKIAGYGGIALAMPVLLWQVWRFVVPGLHANEKRWAYPFVGAVWCCSCSALRSRSTRSPLRWSSSPRSAARGCSSSFARPLTSGSSPT